jgi:hypothetical protein
MSDTGRFGPDGVDGSTEHGRWGLEPRSPEVDQRPGEYRGGVRIVGTREPPEAQVTGPKWKAQSLLPPKRHPT